MKHQQEKREIRALESIKLLPSMITSIKIKAPFRGRERVGYIERAFNFTKKDGMLAFPNSIITPDKPILQIANFSDRAITLQQGQLLGFMVASINDAEHKNENYKSDLNSTRKLTTAIKSIVQAMQEKERDDENDILGNDTELGPKTILSAPNPWTNKELLE